MNKAALFEKLGEKVRPHLDQFAPVWLVSDVVLPADESVILNVMFQHPRYGWVNRRYKYDGFNNVLYYKGQVVVDEYTALAVQENEPFITTTVSDIPDSYGG